MINGHTRAGHGHGAKYSLAIPGLQHRPLLPTILEGIRNAKHIEFIPYKQFWNSPTPDNPQHIEQLRDEVYTADDWFQDHQDLLAMLPFKNPDGTLCTLPRAIIGLEFLSDATLLGHSTGHPKLWPLYLIPLNLAQSVRGCPTQHACYHIAYFIEV